MRTFFIGLLLAALSLSVRAESLEFKAAPESVKLGVGRYVVEHSGKVLDIQVLDGKGAQMATIQGELGGPQGIAMEVKAGSDDLSMTWSLATGRFAMRDNVTGDTILSTPSPDRPKVPMLEGSKLSLINDHLQVVGLAVVAMEETLTNLGLHPRFPSYSSQAGQAPDACPVPGAKAPLLAPRAPAVKPQASTCPPSCNGAIVESQYYVAGSRSLGCNAADQNVNNQCSNGYCYGCCRVLGCDCYCAGPGGSSDFLCICSAEGQACSAPALYCGGDPDPGDGGGGGGEGGGGGGGGGAIGCRGPGGVCMSECFACADVVPAPTTSH